MGTLNQFFMTINRALCEKLYFEVKLKLQDAFVQRGMVYRDTDTSIWKLEEPKTKTTYFQMILEEATSLSFSSTFNNMYLWRKKNEVQTKDSVNFQEDYFSFFTNFLGYTNPQDYLKAYSQTLHNFFGIKPEGRIVVIQPIFDPIKEAHLAKGGAERPRFDEQTLDPKDTECLIELINLFHDYNQILPKRIYDQDIIRLKDEAFVFDETNLYLNKINCIFSIGLFSNYFFLWFLENQAIKMIECKDKPYRFRIKYFNQNLQQNTWSDFYEGNDNFDVGFLLKTPVKLPNDTVLNCYFICGIKNKATHAIANYLCNNWKTIQQKQDSERNIPFNDNPFLIVFKVSETDFREIYCEKLISLQNQE